MLCAEEACSWTAGDVVPDVRGVAFGGLYGCAVHDTPTPVCAHECDAALCSVMSKRDHACDYVHDLVI